MRATATVLIMLATTCQAIADDPVPDKDGYTLFNPTPDPLMRSFDTDRPTKSNVPFTVDAGHVQYETDVAVYAHSEAAGSGSDAWTIVDPTLKLGLTNAIDAELQLTPYESVATHAAGATTRQSGIGDTILRLKANLFGNDHGNAALAVIPYVKIPTAATPLGNGRFEGGLLLPFSMNTAGGFTVILMPEGDYLRNAADNGYHGVIDFLVNVSHPIDKRWNYYVEAYAAQSLQAHAPPVRTLDAALTCALGSNAQLDLGGNFSLNDAAPRAQLYAGLSQRF